MCPGESIRGGSQVNVRGCRVAAGVAISNQVNNMWSKKGVKVRCVVRVAKVKG